MFKIKFFNKLSAVSLALCCICTPACAATNNNGQTSTNPTDQINIFEQEDEKKVFDTHGFTRGDMTYLYSGEFDQNKIEDISGQVEEVFRVQFPDNDCYLIAIISTSTNKGRMAVNLGPTWYLEEKDVAVNEGDTIQIKGAKMRTNGRFVLIATELTKDGKTINLRDKEGSSLWGSPKAQKGGAECMKPEKKRKSLWGNS